MDTAIEAPLACDLSKLDEDARAREQTLLAWSRDAYTKAEWTGDEYRFSFASDPRTLANLGELLAYERLCCPFLRFAIEVDRDDASLVIGGREGAKGFIESEFARR